eukprot:g3118.t1
MEFACRPGEFQIERAIEPAAPVLALLGDIGILTSSKMIAEYRRLLEWCSTKFEAVLVLTGNHEYYNTQPVGATSTAAAASFQPVTKEEADATLRQLCGIFRNVHMLSSEDGAMDINGVLILGTTLWSAVPGARNRDAPARRSVEGFLNDYQLIYTAAESAVAGIGSCSGARDGGGGGGGGGRRRIDAEVSSNRWFRSEVAWIRESIEAGRGRHGYETVVVLTHHAPSLEGTSDPVHGRPPPHGHNLQGHGFASDLDFLFGQDIRVWAFGHTHYNCDFVRNGTRVVSNQKGYGWHFDKVRYDPAKVIEVEAPRRALRGGGGVGGGESGGAGGGAGGIAEVDEQVP